MPGTRYAQSAESDDMNCLFLFVDAKAGDRSQNVRLIKRFYCQIPSNSLYTQAKSSIRDKYLF